MYFSRVINNFMKWFNISPLLVIVLYVSCSSDTSVLPQDPHSFIQVSGIYPHLAYYNQEGECGTGAVVPWAGKLWVVTYGPHLPLGSSDKLYAITPGLEQEVFDASIGGTPANRMIHTESKQLFIGPYAIDSAGKVRVIPYEQMPGRHTGNARHLTDPAGKIYYGTMEEGFYEVEVLTLKSTMLYPDGNENGRRVEQDTITINPSHATLPGAHGKGLYSGQGMLVYSNNGEATPQALKQFDIESGALAEWNGKNWTVVRRNQFVEVTGPGGIYGNKNPTTDPIWTTGWDHKSLIVGVRSPAGWSFYRLPKASHSYDGAHGWNTEWPRIRDVGTLAAPDYLMTMHGMFWRFPHHFTAGNSAGIRPRSAYLKVIGDFARWNGQLVFGCDDSAQREFLNKRLHKGGIEGPGQSNSNLWFTNPGKPDQLGPNTASGSVWLNETIQAHKYSEPFLFDGWPKRSVWIQNTGKSSVDFIFEVDTRGDGEWEPFMTVKMEPESVEQLEFSDDEKAEWIKVKTGATTSGTVSFNYTDPEERTKRPAEIFRGMANVEKLEAIGGLLYGLPNDRRSLGIAAQTFTADQKVNTGYYELDEKLQLIKKQDAETNDLILSKFAIPEQVVEVQESSVLIVDDQGRRWRLPMGDKAFDGITKAAQLRICREVATERDLFNCHGTFYELPSENADGFAKIRPIASHSFRIHDYASYRGMLVMTGIDPDASAGPHLIRSQDGQAAVWAGVIDDLWQLGKPAGHGGPWKNSQIEAGQPSDPYLIGFYDKKSLTLFHDSQELVTFTLEVEPIGHGPWMHFMSISVKPGEKWKYEFSEGFQARWIRFKADKSCRATSWLVYE